METAGVEILIAEAQGGDAVNAIAMLEALLRQPGVELPEGVLGALVRLEPYPGDGELVSAAARLHRTVEYEMRRRRLWKRFRRAELGRLVLSAARWGAGLLAMAAALLTAVFGGIVGLQWLLRWMGFL